MNILIIILLLPLQTLEWFGEKNQIGIFASDRKNGKIANERSKDEIKVPFWIVFSNSFILSTALTYSLGGLTYYTGGLIAKELMKDWDFFRDFGKLSAVATIYGTSIATAGWAGGVLGASLGAWLPYKLTGKKEGKIKAPNALLAGMVGGLIGIGIGSIILLLPKTECSWCMHSIVLSFTIPTSILTSYYVYINR